MALTSGRTCRQETSGSVVEGGTQVEGKGDLYICAASEIWMSQSRFTIDCCRASLSVRCPYLTLAWDNRKLQIRPNKIFGLDNR